MMTSEKAPDDSEKKKRTHFNRNEPITGRVSARMVIHSSAVVKTSRKERAKKSTLKPPLGFASMQRPSAGETRVFTNHTQTQTDDLCSAALKQELRSWPEMLLWAAAFQISLQQNEDIFYLLNMNIWDVLSFSSLLLSELNECICRVLSDTNVCHVSYKQQLDIVSTWLIHRSAGASAEVWQPDILSLFIMISPSSSLERDVCMSPLRAAIMSGL